MNKVIVLPFAKNDIRQAVKWYNKEKVGLGNEFLEQIDYFISIIENNPSSFAVKYDNVRLAFINKFPYIIHYEYFDNKNTILVKAIFHTSRNPNLWENRKPKTNLVAGWFLVC